VTEPFTDFSVDALVRLALTRTYSSADASLYGGPVGPLGRGWHHDWEGTLSCRDEFCTVGRGLAVGFLFRRAETVTSLDGAETLQLYRPTANPAENRNLLVKRSSGLWTLHLANGHELHYGTTCDACGAADAYCSDPLAGGKARLVRMVDPRGAAVNVSYDRPAGTFIQLQDDLGHVLALRSSTACSDGLARELRYDGALVASYEYVGVDLMRAADADGATLRSYVYEPAGTGLLLSVKNESGGTAAEFSYDAEWRAIGVVDPESNVAVSYDQDGTAIVTEYFGNGQSAAGQRTFDLSSRIVSVSDGCSCGPARTFKWEAGALVCSSDSQGMSTYREHDALGRVVRQVRYTGSECPPSSLGIDAREEWTTYGITKPIGQGVNLALDAVTAVSRMSSLDYTKYDAESLSYDPTPQPIDPAGYACQQVPLPAGSVVCRRTQAGYTHTSTGALLLQKTHTFFSYDERGRLVRTLGPKNQYGSTADVMPIEERTYWPDTETLARRGRLKEVQRYASPTSTPLVTSYDYDAFGVYQVTQPNGGLTTIVRDVRGRPVTILGPDGHARSTRYYDGLDPRVEILPGGGAVRSGYDALGRRATVEHLDGDPDQPGPAPTVRWSEHTTYDQAGNPIRVERRDASGAVTWQRDREYDVQRRMVRETNPESPASARTNAFDGSGFLTTATDEEGRATTFTHDWLGRVTKVRRSGVDAGGAPAALDVAQYAYGMHSDVLASVTDGAARQTTYTYDDYGRLRKLSSPTLTGGDVSFTYDSRGNLQQKEDAYVTLSYAYDGLDRVLTANAVNSSTGSSITYTYGYDESPYPGALTSVVEPDRTVRFGYDVTGRLTSETIEERDVATQLVTRYVYDAGGAVAEIAYPSGLHVGFIRDAATAEIVQVKDLTDGTLYADQVTHAPGGPVTSLLLGNGLTLSHSLNRRYEPQAISSGPVSLVYGVTPAGDVGSISHGVAARRFEYDFLDRLAHAYDENGTSQTVESSQARYEYTYGTDRLERQLAGAGQVPRYWFAHDYEGNASLIARYDEAGTTITGVRCLRHDALNRLTVVGALPPAYLDPYYCNQDSYLESVTARFKYDARNRRIARQDPATGQWTYVVNDPAGHPLSELALVNGAWTKVRDYVWLDGRPLAQIEYPGPAGSGQGYVYYFHLDHIGLPRALTNQAGAAVWSAAVQPYGELVETTSTDPLSGRTVVTNLRLPGQYDERLLGSLGLQGPYYNWNRWYLPGVGRYLELDPVALRGGFNTGYGVDWYGYTWQNPLRWSDPSALVPCGLGDTTYTCCLKKFPGCPECCGGETPPTPPAPPGQPPNPPKPPPTCPTTGQPPPPDVPPMPPGTGCKAMFDVCMGWAASAPSYPGRVARAAACMAAYVACLARGG
jgi:RHS repeat-associated protein